ncbi:MAG TPA: hypothetical protein VGG74_07745 [Kofleriaceae bacterium]|jgi:outer membrane biosynthesis protein TonB
MSSELDRAPFDAFVATRDRLVGELKAAGDKAAAAALAKRKRPTISAWAVNQLWWHARAELEALIATAQRLRTGELAEAAAYRDHLAKLRARAAELLAADGHPANEPVLRRIVATLSAIAAAGGFDPDPPGALVADRDPPGFDALAMPAPRESPPAPVHAPAPAPAKKPAHDAEREAKQRAEHEAKHRAEREARERAQLERELHAAREHADKLAKAAARARDALAAAETELDAARANVAELEARSRR